MASRTARGSAAQSPDASRPGVLWQTLTFLGRGLLVLELVALTALVVVLAASWGAYRCVLPAIPQPHDIEKYEPKTASVLYASNGEEIARVFDEDRELVNLSDIPKTLQDATVAIEDKRFRQHKGYDMRRLVGVTLRELHSGGQTQGASTLTMQLAREIYLSKAKSFGRKIQEIGLAVRIERVYAKDEILEMYLNQVCYGDGAYGVKAAARRFFQKDLCELQLHECALLAALPNNPQGLSPYDHPTEATHRRDLVLREMASQGFISPGEAKEALEKPLGVQPRNVRGLLSFKDPYFTEYAVQELVKRYGHDKVYGGGLRVYTSLNRELQAQAQEFVCDGVASHRGARVRQGSCVVLDPQTGKIFAVVGGLGWTESDQYNRAVLAERQPGSAMKPFVWTTALEYGFTPNTPVPGSPCAFDVGGGLVWAPKNSGGGGGMYTLASGLRNSVNVVSARLTMSVGPQAVARTARRMGIRTRLRPFPSIALGTEGVTALDMATAYSAFANGGYRVEPTCIDKIYDHHGILIDRGEPKRTRVISRRIAYEMATMMQGVVAGGTGRQAQGLGAPTAGKTGTTERSCDAWFVGYTPRVSCAVWVGNDENDPMGSVFGGNVPCPIWRKVMGAALPLLEREGGEFPGPGYEVLERKAPRVKLAVGKPVASEDAAKSAGGGGGRGAPRDLFN